MNPPESEFYMKIKPTIDSAVSVSCHTVISESSYQL
jgi:hypothetical protein